jgi:hypothetical protein
VLTDGAVPTDRHFLMGCQCSLTVRHLLTGVLMTLRVVGPGFEILGLRSNADTDVNIMLKSVFVYVNCDGIVLAELQRALSRLVQ